jgi:hypothetical protein
MARTILSHVRRNAVAYVALFLAMGGGAIAASNYIRSTDTVPAGDLKGSTYGDPLIANAAITNDKLAQYSLTITPGTGLSGGGATSLGGGTTIGVADGGVGTNQLADRSVTAAKLANPTIPIFFESIASIANPETDIFSSDGLVLSARCTLTNGMPELVVNYRGTVPGADMEVPYNRAGDTVAHDQTTGLDSVHRPLIPDETPTDGTQLGGTFIYTTPDGRSVSGNFQWWAGDTVKPMGGAANCLFSGIASSAG